MGVSISSSISISRLQGEEEKKEKERKKVGELSGTCPSWRLTFVVSVASGSLSYLCVHRELIRGLMIGEMRLNNKKHYSLSLSFVPPDTG